MKIPKLAKGSLIIILGLLLFYFLLTPGQLYEFGHWGRIFNWEKHKYSFCTYIVPSTYQFASYENDGSEYLNEAVFFENREHSRYLILIKFQEFPMVELNSIKIGAKIPFRSYDYQYGKLHNIRRWYYLLWNAIPGFMSTDFNRLGDKLLLRGIQVKDRRELTTQTANIKYFIGSFERLGFYRQYKGFGGYPVPVLDFLNPRYGGVAIIRSTASPETIFAILATPDEAHFDANEFREILKSITFEKQTPDTKEWLQSFKKTKQRYRKETTRWGPFKWEREKVE